MRVVNFFFFQCCRFKNRSPHKNLDTRLSIQPFIPSLISALNQVDLSSPSRNLSNLFWQTLPWNLLKEELAKLHIFDTGCGSGAYEDYLNKCSNGIVNTYVELDVYEHPSWKTHFSTNKQFHRFNGKSIATYIPENTNFFMSQSAIEHFQNDKRYFEDIRMFVELQKRPTIQVHLFPSVACMKLYGSHGYRQYTPRTISSLTRLFPNAQCLLFGLGGPACNRVHEQFITKPLQSEGVDYRKSKPDEYLQALQYAIKEDEANPNALDNPSFWALVICSYWKKPFSL